MPDIEPIMSSVHVGQAILKLSNARDYEQVRRSISDYSNVSLIGPTSRPDEMRVQIEGTCRQHVQMTVDHLTSSVQCIDDVALDEKSFRVAVVRANFDNRRVNAPKP